MRVSQAVAQVDRDTAFWWDRQRIRDVPRSCTCPWSWGKPVLRWVRLSTSLGCPWHSQAPWMDVREL